MCKFQQFRSINKDNSYPIKLCNWKSRLLEAVKFYKSLKISCKKKSAIGFNVEYFMLVFNWFHNQLTNVALISTLHLREYLKRYPRAPDATDAFDMSLFTVQCRLNFNAMKKYCTVIIRNCGTTSGNDNYGGWPLSHH